MAKYPVLKKFRDRATGGINEIGDHYTTSDKERVKKLQAGGWIGKEDKPTSTKPKPEVGDLFGGEEDKSKEVQQEDTAAK
ncbi:hypothetical protein EJP82_01280 [Paenibacillus anaericanus]|uniref:Uncharacterized protein n=1 Tax=Paenibacillus anaericanus TaxID=170367 RepID=A0A433YFI5_9BACL|nr:hypothetical protein [Paenibacillus anaericanus]RUT48603.1 hypothetical protein EJP82_01280 [Paenibacillus anaericanus]